MLIKKLRRTSSYTIKNQYYGYSCNKALLIALITSTGKVNSTRRNHTINYTCTYSICGIKTYRELPEQLASLVKLEDQGIQ